MEKIPYSNEIQLEIDDVYACPGHCPGCVLSSLERKSQQPDMQWDTLVCAIDKLKEYIPTLSHLEKVNLTYGIADHLLMPIEYLIKTYDLGASLIEDTGFKNQYNGVFYTASMIGKHEHIMKKVHALYEHSQKRGVPFYIIAVLDPKHLYHHKFADIYKSNIIDTQALIGKVDLSINLSEEAIDNISPQDLYTFAKNNHFDEVTINWTPTKDNLQYVYFNQDKLADWLIAFDEILAKDGKMGTSYRPVMRKTINNLMCKTEENYSESFYDGLSRNLPELIHKSLQIDDKGNIFPKYEAVGDIAHTPRIGIAPLGNIMQKESIAQLLSQSQRNTEKFVMKQFTKQPCLSCEYNKFCANSGFHIYNHVLNSFAEDNIKELMNENLRKNGCYHIGKRLFSHYYKTFQQ